MSTRGICILKLAKQRLDMAIGIVDNRARRISRNIVIVKYREIAISWGIVCVDSRGHENRRGKTSWRIVRPRIAYTINRGDYM